MARGCNTWRHLQYVDIRIIVFALQDIASFVLYNIKETLGWVKIMY